MIEEFFCFENGGIEFIRVSLPGAWAVFSTRNGGVSTPPFLSLNMAFHVGDAEQAVLRNRKVFTDFVGIPLDRVVCAQQVHGTKIQVVTPEDCGKGVYSEKDAMPETDAMVTAHKNVVLAGFFADCVPIYIVDPVKSVVALAHAGWKGTVNRIASKTVNTMCNEFASEPSCCYAFIGPSIGPCCYDVGDEVLSQLDTGKCRFVSALKKDNEKCRFDLWAANKEDLLSIGFLPEHIGVSEICTGCGPRFFSYRRDKGQTGRMAAFIRLL